jgi:hypothetical protein
MPPMMMTEGDAERKETWARSAFSNQANKVRAGEIEAGTPYSYLSWVMEGRRGGGGADLVSVPMVIALLPLSC